MSARVAIVIPCYRQEHFLRVSVASALEQSRPPDEIFIVDDGSDTAGKDSYYRRAEEMDPKVRVIHQENRGLSAARNRGISESSAEYLLPLDADDVLEPACLERTLAYLEESPRLGFVYTWVTVFGEENYVWRCPPFEPDGLLRRNRLVASNLFRRQVWEDVGGYDEGFGGYEDWDFWISAWEAGWAGACVPEALQRYRVRVNSMLHGELSRAKRVRLVARLLEKHAGLYGRLPVKESPEEFVERLEREDAGESGEFSLDGVSRWGRARRKASLAVTYSRARQAVRTPRRLVFAELAGLRRGGLEVVALAVANGLREDGVETVFVCTREEGPWAAKAREAGHGVELLDADQHLQFVQLLQHYEPSLLLSHGSWLTTPWAHRAGLPILWVVQNALVWHHPDDWALIAERVRLCEAVVAVSRYAGETFARHAGLTEERLRIIPNGVDGTTATKGAQDARHSPPRLVLPARYHPSKGHAPLIEAVRRLRGKGSEIAVDCYGDQAADGFHYRSLRQQVDSAGMGEWFRLHDATEWSRERLADYDGFILPSVVEGWSLAATEAACAGLPLVLTEVGSARELAEAGASVLAIPPPTRPPLDYVRYQIGQYAWDEEHAERMVAALERFLAEPERGRAAADAAPRLAEAFSARAMVDQYRQLVLPFMKD